MHQVFEEYLEKVCSQLQQENHRNTMYMELSSHLECFYQQALAEGKSREEAVMEAMETMETMENDPIELGRLLEESFSG